MNPEDLQKVLEAIGKGNFNINGDLVLSKKVDYEIGNVESGGIGIQINNGTTAGNNHVVHDKDDGNTCQEEEEYESDPDESEEGLNYFAPTNSLQRLLKQPWFAEVRTDERYDAAWTDAFIEALMGSEYGEQIARDWAVQGLRERKTQLKGYAIGLLKDAGVLKGSYGSIARTVGIIVNEENKKDPHKTFADYMARGKRQPYAPWVKEYVGNHTTS